MRGLVAVVVVLAGCPPKAPDRPIEYVGGSDRHPGVPIDASVGAPPPCAYTTETALLETFYGTIPSGVTEDEAYNATLQSLIAAGGLTIVSQDPVAHTIVTSRFDGQTWLSTCQLNHYFMYEFRIAIAGSQMIVSADCWHSVGWEASVGRSRNRGELRRCEMPALVTKNDAKLPSMVFDGAMAMVDLRRMRHPGPPPPGLAAPKNPRWWCTAIGGGNDGSCDRSRDRCESERRDTIRKGDVVPTECFPTENAQCFDMHLRQLGTSMASCHPTEKACRAQLEYVRTQKDKATPTTDCRPVD